MSLFIKGVTLMHRESYQRYELATGAASSRDACTACAFAKDPAACHSDDTYACTEDDGAYWQLVASDTPGTERATTR